MGLFTMGRPAAAPVKNNPGVAWRAQEYADRADPLNFNVTGIRGRETALSFVDATQATVSISITRPIPKSSITIEDATGKHEFVGAQAYHLAGKLLAKHYTAVEKARAAFVTRASNFAQEVEAFMATPGTICRRGTDPRHCIAYAEAPRLNSPALAQRIYHVPDGEGRAFNGCLAGMTFALQKGLNPDSMKNELYAEMRGGGFTAYIGGDRAVQLHQALTRLFVNALQAKAA